MMITTPARYQMAAGSPIEASVPRWLVDNATSGDQVQTEWQACRQMVGLSRARYTDTLTRRSPQEGMLLPST